MISSSGVLDKNSEARLLAIEVSRTLDRLQEDVEEEEEEEESAREKDLIRLFLQRPKGESP